MVGGVNRNSTRSVVSLLGSKGDNLELRLGDIDTTFAPAIAPHLGAARDLCCEQFGPHGHVWKNILRMF